MKKICARIKKFVNNNIGRKLMFLMVPVMCGIMIITILLTSRIYTRRLVENIEEGSQYITDTFQLNMDFCTTDVKSMLNVLSLDDHVIELVTMDRDSMDYARLLACEKELRKLFGTTISTKNYIQDVFILGNNGYQNNYLQNNRGNIMETDWFQDYVDEDEKGFQYILPHTVDYYDQGKSPANQAISVVLPIKSDNAIVGYALCDIRMKVAALPEGLNDDINMEAYLVNNITKDYYDFQTESNYRNGKEDFILPDEAGKEGFMRSDDDFIIYSKMESSDWYIAVVYRYRDIIAPVVAAQRVGILMLLLGCAAVAVVAWMISRFMKKPINDIICRIRQVEQEDFTPVKITETDSQPGELVLIRNRLEEMIQRINELVHKVYLDEIYQKNMEYENLVNQVNPHFIFNVLQLIQSKAVLSENYEIEEIVVALSRMMRYTMSNRDKIVTLKEECGYIENYLELYRQRYSQRFSYQVSLEKELEDYPVLKFILQPIVENCIRHGFKQIKREGKVVITVCHKAGNICFAVEDNGRGIEKDKLKELKEYVSDSGNREFESIGLKNTYQRLKLTYGEEASMSIDSEVDQYTAVYITIPDKCDKNGVEGSV